MPCSTPDAHAPTEWDPLGPEFVSDRSTVEGEMRNRCPVAYTDQFGGFFGVFRHEDIVRAAADTTTYSSALASPSIPAVATGGRRLPVQSDPPEHGRYRRLLRAFFLPDRLAEFEAVVRATARELITHAVGQTGCTDIGRHFTYPFPARVLCHFLGLPQEDWTVLKDLTFGMLDSARVGDEAAIRRANDRINTYVDQIVDDRRGQPRDPEHDVITALLQDPDTSAGGFIAGILVTLFTAGHESSTGALGICLRFLAEHPDIQDHLRRHPEAIPEAAEELIRLDTPTTHSGRYVTREAEIGGRRLLPGDRVALMWTSGSRDPDAFDGAGEYRPGRRPNRSLAFGTGIHTCVGAPLARLELKVGLEEFLASTSAFTLGGPTERFPWPLNGIRTLPLRITAPGTSQ